MQSSFGYKRWMLGFWRYVCIGYYELIYEVLKTHFRQFFTTLMQFTIQSNVIRLLTKDCIATLHIFLFKRCRWSWMKFAFYLIPLHLLRMLVLYFLSCLFRLSSLFDTYYILKCNITGISW